MSNLVFAVLFSNLVWALSPLMAKIGLENVSDVSFLLIRFGLSAIFFLPVIMGSMQKFRQLPVSTVLLGILTVTAHYYLQVVALRQVPVTWYVFFYSLCPILNLVVVGEAMSRRNLMVAVLAIFGTGLFVDFKAAPEITSTMILILLMSVLTWVFFTWIVKSWQKVLSDVEVSGATSTVSFLVFAVWAILNPQSLVSSWSFKAGGITLLLAVLLPLAFVAYSYSLRKNPSVAVLGQYSEPIFGILGAVVFLDETISLRQSVGLLVIGVALWVLLVRPLKAISV